MLENQADHEFAIYETQGEAFDHIQISHGPAAPNYDYAIDQHHALHFHRTGNEHPPEWADADELQPAPAKTCPHCGTAVTILVRKDLAERARKAAEAMQTGLVEYLAATADLLRYAEALDPAELT